VVIENTNQNILLCAGSAARGRHVRQGVECCQGGNDRYYEGSAHLWAGLVVQARAICSNPHVLVVNGIVCVGYLFLQVIKLKSAPSLQSEPSRGSPGGSRALLSLVAGISSFKIPELSAFTAYCIWSVISFLSNLNQ